MKRSDFNYHLPEEFIAQYPAEKRDHSRLLEVNREQNKLNAYTFLDFPQFCNSGDLLILNNSRVFPARLQAKRKTGGRVEILLLSSTGSNAQKQNEPCRQKQQKLLHEQQNAFTEKQQDSSIKKRSGENTEDTENQIHWDALVKPGRSIRPGETVYLSDNTPVVVLERKSGGISRTIEFPPGINPLTVSEKLGKTPLPPYIRRKADNRDRNRYQTIYAEPTGSTAAPTAGLHFTKTILDTLKDKGVNVKTITLHVGPGTFLPVRSDEIENHKMHSEFCIVNPQLCREIVNTKKRGNKVIAAGTTTTRALETAFKYGTEETGYEGWTTIFIYPPFTFKAVDALLTNFHLPESTLLMLVSAFAGKDLIMKAYQKAVEDKFRFYSYGDCMLII